MSERRRKHSIGHYAVDVPRQILSHHDPISLKLGRLGAAIVFQARKRLGSPPKIVEAEGIRINGRHDAGGVSNLVYFGRRFEYDEILFVERYLRAGDQVVDGGANIGLFSLVVADVVGPTGKVWAYEPSSTTNDRLLENVELNALSQIVPRRAALGPTQTTMSFTMGWDVSNGLVDDVSSSGPVETVDVVPLDDELAGQGHFALVKLDLEGGELGALRGAVTLLSEGRIDVLLVEAFDHQMRRVGDTRAELLDELRGHGYAFFDYKADRAGGLQSADPPQDGNFLAIRHDAVAEVRSRLES